MLTRKPHPASYPSTHLNPNLEPLLNKRLNQRLAQPQLSPKHDAKEAHAHKSTHMRQQRGDRLRAKHIALSRVPEQ